MATVRDIAALVGVSVATVSRVLNNSEAVTAETVAKVNNAIKELNYEKKPPKTKRTNLFGVIVPNITNPFFSELLDVIEKEAFHHGRCVLFFNSRNSIRQEKVYLQECYNHEVDGVFLVPSNMSDDYLLEIKQQYRFPIVLLTHATDIIPSVAVDHPAGGRLIAEHLLANGHREIGYIGPINNKESKLRGFASRLEEKAHPLKRAFMFDYSQNNNPEQLKAFIASLLDENQTPKVSAIYCSNDMYAEKVLKVLWAYQIRVPEQVEIVGFDNSQIAKTLDFSSISQPMRDIAHLGFTVMLECLQKPEKLHSYPARVLLPKLVTRKGIPGT